MNSDKSSTVYPCPFSKKYGIPVEQAWALLKIFFIYRLLTAIVIIGLYFSPSLPASLEMLDRPLYFNVGGVYFILILLSGVLILWRKISYTTQAQVTIFIDIICLTLLMHACGGVSSGIGILLVISIAAGGMLVGGRCAFLFAAMASLAVLFEQVYAILHNNASTSSLTYSGMLGASYFTIALLSVVMAQRTERSELLAHERQKTIVQLEELNQHIIQYMQSGILILDIDGRVELYNQAAAQLLQQHHFAGKLSDQEKTLAEALQQWQHQPESDFKIVMLSCGNEVQVRFSSLKIAENTFYMLILEDIALYNQRLQQSKLASLGRLTASMAHEIRNPLGAISHAAQLLSEAPGLSPQDLRLTEIIHTHSQRVNEIIESILHLSRRKISRKSTIHLDLWLPDFVENLCEELETDRTIKIDMAAENIRIEMDEGHLRQILSNLCRNALKYGDDKQPVFIDVTLAQDKVQIHVMNFGPEIDEQVQQHLFEPFFTTSTSGTGLGLYISRELAALNQARLNYTYQSHKNDFTLTVKNARQQTLDV